MDADRFDGLTKAFAGGASRRRVLKGLGGSLAGAALAAVGFGRTSAAPGGNSACAQFCHDTFGAGSPNAGICTSEAARGIGRFRNCNGACVDTFSDGANCGSCGAGCGDNQICRGGICVPTGPTCNANSCPDGCCDSSGVCVIYNAQSNQVCGSAGALCAPCESGQCNAGTCVAVPPTCDADSCPNGCCDTSGACIPYANQSGSACGTGGAACEACASTQGCSSGTCTTWGCDAGSTCESQCPNSSNPYCYCGKTIAGTPVCYYSQNGCSGGYCESNDQCESGTCITDVNLCVGTHNCTTDEECGPGAACIDLNGGCGGCSRFTGDTQGICNPICSE